MEKRSEAPGNLTQMVRVAGSPRGITADQIIAGQREAGMRPGTYVATCDWCRGAGHVRLAGLPYNVCIKCDGTGVLTINGDRHGDSHKRRMDSVKRTLLFVGVSMIVAAIFCAILLWRANALRP